MIQSKEVITRRNSLTRTGIFLGGLLATSCVPGTLNSPSEIVIQGTPTSEEISRELFTREVFPTSAATDIKIPATFTFTREPTAGYTQEFTLTRQSTVRPKPSSILGSG